MTKPTCPRHYYLLPAERCRDAIATYEAAKNRAMTLKRTIWHERYGAAAAITGGKIMPAGLVWDDANRYHQEQILGGWSRPKPIPTGIDPKPGQIYATPARNSARGKAIAADLATVQEALNDWQFALEKALGINGTVLHANAFHKTVAHILPDGQCIASVPDDLNKPRVSTPTYSSYRSFDATTMPDWAIPISAEQYRALLASINCSPDETS